MADLRLDYKIIVELVAPGSQVLDLGCGDGTLLQMLEKEKQVKGQGIEFDETLVYQCVEKGLNVFHGDIASGLADYPDKSFDYVILNKSMQELKKVDPVIEDALRIGKQVIIGFPNFAHLDARIQMFFFGRSPVTPALPFHWHDSPNLHFLSIRDFQEYCRDKKLNVIQVRYINDQNEVRLLPNLFARDAVFLVQK